MKKHTIGAIVAGAALAVGSVTTGVAVHAASDAPWQATTIKSPNAVGTITLVDADNQPVTSGSIDQPLAAYAVGSGPLTAGDTAAHTSATLGIYTPTSVVSERVYPSQPDAVTTGPDSWTGLAVSAPTTQDQVPAKITGGPAADLTGSLTLRQYIGGYENKQSDAAYAGVYELRLSTGAAGHGVSPTYAVLDLKVIGDTWHLYGEGGTAATTTTLAVSPAVGKVGASTTLTATVSPAAAGTVKFLVDGTEVGSVAVNTVTGKATTTWTPSATGSVQLAANFTPTDTTAYAASESSASTYTVAANPTVSPTWPAFRYGTSSTVRVAVSSTPAASGTVGIVYAGRVIASAPVSGGVANVKVPATALPAGARSLLARFTSSAPSSVASKDSAAKTVSVAKAVAKIANTTAPTKVRSTKKATFVFTVTAAGGTVTGTAKVYDGSKVVATVALRGGKATVALKLKKGKHSIRAAFLGNANVAPATGSVVKVTSK
ncbi:hypothetical protein JCM18899A_37590 [Nocardioides sp. AN3]